MSVSQFEQLDRLEDHDESYDRALLQTAITEAFAFLNAGARQEAIDRIKQYQCPASALVRQNWRLEEGRISGSS
jgi:hypothetical protein